MAASSSTFTAANSTINYCYDVFLNHRGPDVKKTFARSLYLRLVKEGLTAFLDQEELQTGYYFPSQIKQAIKTATLHVAIFSRGYAESEWCLRELVMMLESKAPIIPVFYLVTPAEVRWTKGKDGKYAQDLQILAEKKTQEGKPRYDCGSIEVWRAALSLVAEYKGFELEVCNGEKLQLELLDKLVENIKGMLETLKKPDLPVAKFLTGMDEKVKHFEDTVLFQKQLTGKPRIVGIVGLGGIGKTTLAEEFFKRKNSNYRKTCFLSNVRETSITSLQRELLKSLTSIDEPIDSVIEGKAMLRKHLKFSNSSQSLDDVDHACKALRFSNSSKSLDDVEHACNDALIILDDVDGSHQLDALLLDDLSSGSLKLISSGSLILITSRYKQVLKRSKVQSSSIYNVTGLNDEHSRELFCYHAFSQTYPFPGFESLVDRFLEACKGFPLCLKVYGANLYGRDISHWEEDLRSLELGSLPNEIIDTLKISYDDLQPEEKQIFLDSACFFKGLHMDSAISIWNESGWRGRRSLQHIQDKCLVEVDSFKRIQMHDLLKAMGRVVAEDSSPRRLWHWTENVKKDLSQQSSDGQAIIARGIKMDLSEYNAYGYLLRKIKRSRLQIIDTEGVVLERILKRAKLPSLLWLRWVDCPYSSLPSWIPKKNLRYLEVSGSLLNTLWEKESESQLPIFLEGLKANDCVKLKNITGLEQLTKLRQLSVSGCSELEELPSMEAFVFLEELWAAGCVSLKNLPELGLATKLRAIDISGCSELEGLGLPCMGYWERIAEAEEHTG